jgi:hypothetical protein
VNFYLDEDISPKVAEILRKRGIDAVSAHESDFKLAARMLERLATKYPDGLGAYTIEFVTKSQP